MVKHVPLQLSGSLAFPCSLAPRRVAWMAAVFLVASVAGALAAPPTEPGGASITGSVRVVDGDTIDVDGRRVRLEGIDAPEASQDCQSATGEPWPCGRRATAELRALIDGGTVECHERGLDKYGRVLAMCLSGGKNINELMVRRGYAWAFVKYSTEFAGAETEARQAKIGVWQGDAQAPWDFRHKEWTVAETAAPTGCAIKGNISNRGHIYHVPWGVWYDKVRIDEAHGERWFCSEDDAIAAGWRAAVAN